MRDGGDQVGAGALQADPLLRAAQADRDALDVTRLTAPGQSGPVPGAQRGTRT